MNELESAKMQTPIEIALGIDEEGMTTARKLYEFLELTVGTIQDGAKATSLKMNLLRKMLIIGRSSLMKNGILTQIQQQITVSQPISQRNSQ